MKTPTINPVFQRLIPPLQTFELEQLEANIVRDGCRDPLVIWQGHDTLLDGHNRLAICQRRGIPFEVSSIEIQDESAAVAWIILNQLGRRNLSPDAASLLRGRLYEARKREVPNPEGVNQHGEVERKTCGQPSTAAQVAAETGVSPRTVENDAAFTRAADKLGVTADVIAGTLDAPRAAVIDAAKALPPNPTGAQIEEAKAKLPHVARNSGENEWYTPPDFIAAAKATMGGIALDPASSAVANRTVGAEVIFTKEDDGLSKDWAGTLWMNPPYAQPLCAQFCEKAADSFDSFQIEAGIVLVNNATETRWFQRMLKSATAVCFPAGRIRFLDPDGNPGGSPLQGQALVYFGADANKFAEHFGSFGTVVTITR